MISPKTPRIFPLCVNASISLADGDPATFASRNSRPLIRLVKPWNNAGGFQTMALFRFIVVGKRAVKWIQSRRELDGNVIASMGGVRIVDPAIVFGPFFVPTAYPIGHRVIPSRFLADPKDGRYDLAFPGGALSGLVRISCQLAWRKSKRRKG